VNWKLPEKEDYVNQESELFLPLGNSSSGAEGPLKRRGLGSRRRIEEA